MHEYYQNKLKNLNYFSERSFIRKNIEKIDLNNIKTAHIIGICGTAMASLASLLIQKGIKVTGSDQACYPPMSNVLNDLNIEILNFDINNLINKDIIIIGNMCGPMNIEAIYCRENNLPHFSIGEILENLFIENKKSIVIAGTHGKTTTTSIAINALKEMNLNPSYLVGGVMKDDNKSSNYNKNSEYFIIEGDEYDTAYFDKMPKFLHYRPYITIITSLELDHIDIYKDYNDYKQAFKYLIEKTNKNGIIVLCIDDKGVKDLLNDIKNDREKDLFNNRKIITYGLSEEADIRILNIENIKEGQKISLNNNDSFIINLFGEYNALNTLSVYTALRFLNLDMNIIKKSFTSFSGAKRRQEIWAEKNNIIIIDDFAHHPTAVYKTLKGIKERYGDKNIIAIFEPRSNTSRAKIFENQYINSFEFANSVYISKPKIKKDGYNPDDFMNIDYVSDCINNKSIESHSFDNVDDIVNYLNINNILKSNDVLVIMSNGDFDNIHKKIYDIIN